MSCSYRNVLYNCQLIRFLLLLLDNYHINTVVSSSLSARALFYTHSNILTHSQYKALKASQAIHLTVYLFLYIIHSQKEIYAETLKRHNMTIKMSDSVVYL